MSSTSGAPAHALPDTTHVASVRVGVRNLERSLAWYDRWFGLVAHALDEHGVLGLAPVGGAVILELVERPGAEQFGGHHTGLYHMALRVPERVDLARWLAHAAQQQLPLVGAADHFVSEAIYLTDPDGHGIEIYWDRPRSVWDGQVHLMTTATLDINDLFSELDTLAINSGTARVPPQTDMGHVHLQVADIDDTITFLRDVIGFDVMMTFGRQAAFLATGGYHHDVGANTWASRGAPPAPDAMAHLEHVTFALPEGHAIEGLQARIAAAGIPARADAGVIEVTDPSGNRLIFRSDAEAQESASP